MEKTVVDSKQAQYDQNVIDFEIKLSAFEEQFMQVDGEIDFNKESPAF